MPTELEWNQRVLRWVYENGLKPNNRPTWVNQVIDKAFEPVRNGTVEKGKYPPHDMQVQYEAEDMVTQKDRFAAARLVEKILETEQTHGFNSFFAGSFPETIRDGHWDNHWIVQIMKDHRNS